MKRRLAAGIVIALGVLAAVVGVSTSFGAKAAPVTLTMWSYDNQDPGLEPVLKQLSKEFEQKHSGVKINLVFKDFNSLVGTVPRALASGSGPDVTEGNQGFQTDAQLVKAKLILPLDKYIKKYHWDRLYSPSTWGMFRWTPDGKSYGKGPIWGIAQTGQDVVAFYNKAKLRAAGFNPDKLPQTFAGFDNMLGKLRAKLPQLERALVGTPGLHQHFLLACQLAPIDFLDETVEQVSTEIAERLRPFADALARLDGIPGVGPATAEVLLAEIGADMSRFPTAGHLAAWAGMCPGNYESAGKRRKGKTRKGSKWLRTALLEAARAAARKKESYLAAQYHRVVPRLGKKKAAVAVGHSILRIVYYLLQRETTYQELGGAYFDARHRDRVERRLVHRLEQLGFEVTLTPKDPAA